MLRSLWLMSCPISKPRTAWRRIGFETLYSLLTQGDRRRLVTLPRNTHDNGQSYPDTSIIYPSIPIYPTEFFFDGCTLVGTSAYTT
jgi:hypothetical protein